MKSKFTYEQLEVASNNGSEPFGPIDPRALARYIIDLNERLNELKQVVEVLKANCHTDASPPRIGSHD